MAAVGMAAKARAPVAVTALVLDCPKNRPKQTVPLQAVTFTAMNTLTTKVMKRIVLRVHSRHYSHVTAASSKPNR